MGIELAKYLTVILLAVSPIGELLIAIPAGVGLGLSPLAVALVAVPANFLPALVLDLAYLAARRSSRVKPLLDWLARPSAQRFLDRYGLAGVVVGTPWLGVYGTVIALRLLGMARRRLLMGILASLLVYTAAVTALSALGFALARG